jgi:hypothetical protein
METKQTAIEFIEQVILKPIQNKLPKEALQALKIAFDNAKKMEKYQIIDAYGQGVADEAGEILDSTKEAERYYEETYGNETDSR